MYRRPRGRGGRSRGRGGRGAQRGRRPNSQVTTANQLPQRHDSFPSDSTPGNAGFGSNSPRHDLFPGEYTAPNVGFSRNPPQQESFPSDPALLNVGYGRDPPQRDPFPSDSTPSNVGFGRNLPRHEAFPSDSTPSNSGFGRNLPPHDHFARDSTPPNVGFGHSPPWHGSISSDPPSGNSPRHDSFTIDTTPLNIDFGGGRSGSSSAFPREAHPLSPELMREKAIPKQTSWQDFELSKGGFLGKHKQIPSPPSEKVSTDNKQLRLDAEFQSQEQERSADSVGTSTSICKDEVDESREKDGNQGDEGSKDGNPRGKRLKVKKDPDAAKPPQFSVEDLTAVNKKVLMVEGTITHDQYFCSLCHAQLNCRRSLEKHMHSTEHIRRIVNLNNTKVFPYFCEVCCCGCPHKEVYDQHLQGKKHLRNMSLSSRNKGDRTPLRPLGDLLDELFKEEVAQEGDGLSLGMSTHMMKFFSMPGPFIGMQYAEEIGLPDDPNPQYTCTLCSVSVDAANHHLHFTSAAHRLAVLKTDYPGKYSELMQLELKKSVFNEKVKAVALEIESKEGRKVELIKRKILKPQIPPQGKFSGGQGKFSGGQGKFSGGQGKFSSGFPSGFSSDQGHNSAPGASSFRGRGTGFVSPLRGRGSGFVRGRGMGRGLGQLKPYGHFSQRPPDAAPYQSGGFVRGRGTDERRGRGRGGLGGGRYFDPVTTDKDSPGQKWSQHQTQMDISAAVVRRRYGPGPGPQQREVVTPSGGVAFHFVTPAVAPPLQAQHTPPHWINTQSPQAPPNWIQQQQASPSWSQPQPVQPPSIQQQQALPLWPQQPAQPTLIQQQQALPPSWPQQQPAQMPFIQQQQAPPPSWPQPHPTQLQQQQAPPSSWPQPQPTPSSWGQPQQVPPQSWGSPATSTATPQMLHASASPGAKPSGGALVSPSHEVSAQQPQPYQVEQPLDPQIQQGKDDAQLEVLLKSIHDQGASQDVVQQLAKINSEEDADAALKLSSALTQALLAYRIKSVSTTMPENPLAAVIGSLQGLSQLNLQNPTSSSNQ